MVSLLTACLERTYCLATLLGKERVPGLPLTCSDANHCLPFRIVCPRDPVYSVYLNPGCTGQAAGCEGNGARARTRRRNLVVRLHVEPDKSADPRIGSGEIRSLFPGSDFLFERLTLAPPLARRSRLGRISCSVGLTISPGCGRITWS